MAPAEKTSISASATQLFLPHQCDQLFEKLDSIFGTPNSSQSFRLLLVRAWDTLPFLLLFLPFDNADSRSHILVHMSPYICWNTTCLLPLFLPLLLVMYVYISVYIHVYNL